MKNQLLASSSFKVANYTYTVSLMGDTSDTHGIVARHATDTYLKFTLERLGEDGTTQITGTWYPKDPSDTKSVLEEYSRAVRNTTVNHSNLYITHTTGYVTTVFNFQVWVNGTNSFRVRQQDDAEQNDTREFASYNGLKAMEYYMDACKYDVYED